MKAVKYFVVLLMLLVVLPEPAPATNSDTVINWASTLGKELWRLSESLTKSEDIRMVSLIYPSDPTITRDDCLYPKQSYPYNLGVVEVARYKELNASVKKKNGSAILSSSLSSVKTMLLRKIAAVQCIHEKAKELAKNFDYTILENSTEIDEFKYCDAKYSNFINAELEPAEGLPKFAKSSPNFREIVLEKDSHFYNISVDVNSSCVHVPTNIFYREKEALGAIMWSQQLDEVFKMNYQSDPSLAWQYFGSSHGILRFFPAMPWNRLKAADIYDCRVRSWYIEAATCSKDMIILFDVSGSMTGFKNYVARMTLKALLETLSNNDFVNVFSFKNETHEVVKCFTSLVQATHENIGTIIESLQPVNKTHKVPLEGNANLTSAFITAFETLKTRRQGAGCSVNSKNGCNQLVMLITDYVSGNLSEVFDEYNREVIDGKTYTPVRVFTYLIGKEVTNVQDIRSMACSNRGYFVHIHSVEEVQQQVLKYINVIARPMILEEENPPPTWTHANLDETRTREWMVSSDTWELQDEDKLVTSVAIPAFDYDNTTEGDPILLGVAGTDVPIDSISKLAQPHQLGVNGYSFIVSNNGYLLLHPLLRASIKETLQKNYNSVDFVEVEQVDDGLGPRVLGDDITKLRMMLVEAKNGSMPGIKVLYHYDDMKRIARVEHDYFFSGLISTPFSMGISLPKKYGNTELFLKDNPLEAKEGKELTGINVTDYFRFSYRVHPDWVYCKYHYLEGHEASDPEKEIWNFLVRLSHNDLNITIKQYEEELQEKNITCTNMTQLGQDAYYCNEDLVKQLVFDGKLTTPFFEKWEASDEDQELAMLYNVSVRFIATAGGLTRWHYVFDDTKNEQVDEHGERHKEFSQEVFGDKYVKSIEETWYKAAVLQAMIKRESIVVATPLPVLDELLRDDDATIKNEDGDITVTASYAIFYKDGESETPASVVGFQFSSESLHARFREITSGEEVQNIDCGNNHDCYVIDSSGYIVISIAQDADNESLVGEFFGAAKKQNAMVLQDLLNRHVFNTVEIFNYQALCPMSSLKVKASAWSLRTPFDLVHNYIKWLLAEMALYVLNWNEYVYAEEDIDYPEVTLPPPPPQENKTENKPEEEKEANFSCDHSISLYILNQSDTTQNNSDPRVVAQELGDVVNANPCYPPYWAVFVPNTNLLLVVVENGYTFTNESCEVPRDTKPQPTDDSTTSMEPCHKLPLGALYRRRLEGCYTYNEKEMNITDCGLGSVARSNPVIFLASAIIVILSSSLVM